ncbi:MAG: dihydroorotase [Methanotrichaceae archaeon]|nr:dihydroorotase [Methanotrichaceae archaeon]
MAISYNLLIKNGRVYTSVGLKSIDIWIKNGKISSLGGPHHAEETINARGMLVLPGAIDVHVHFREPGATYKENWESGSLSAAAGGVTTVIDQPNTEPKTLDSRSFKLKLDLASHNSVVDFCINGGPGIINDLVKSGVTAIGEVFSYEFSDIELQKILKEVETAHALPTIHSEDREVVEQETEAWKHLHDPIIYSKARPNKAEAVAIEKALSWSKNLHICHLSTLEGLELIREAKGKGIKVTCEVAPHHLLFDIKDYLKQKSFLKVNPPLRNSKDCNALWIGLRDGSIDILASDHAPHLPEEKKDDIWEAPPGVPGVETMLPLMLMAVKRNLLSLERLVDAVSTKPAYVFGLTSKGSIEVGKDADLVVVDSKRISQINADRLHSRADWTPYEGKPAIFPQMTLVRGQVVYDGDLQIRPGYGRFLEKQRVLS